MKNDKLTTEEINRIKADGIREMILALSKSGDMYRLSKDSTEIISDAQAMLNHANKLEGK